MTSNLQNCMCYTCLQIKIIIDTYNVSWRMCELHNNLKLIQTYCKMDFLNYITRDFYFRIVTTCLFG